MQYAKRGLNVLMLSCNGNGIKIMHWLFQRYIRHANAMHYNKQYMHLHL